jgi:conjugal transfer pilus assembly protein TraB
MSLRQKFGELDPKNKKRVIWSLVGIVILLVTLTGYNIRSHKTERLQAVQRAREIQIEPDLIQKTMLQEERRQLAELKKTVKEMEKHLKKKESTKLPEIPPPEQVEKRIVPPSPEQRWPLPIGGRASISTPPPPGKSQTQMIGDITVLPNPNITEPTGADKKKGRTVYLPPSFMEAKLLTGFDASTSGKGTNNPEPLLLRIQTPAVLPNDVKRELQGCFVIAEAVGRLDKERADVRLVSLSCLSNEGKAIIDTPIKGFVTDADSKVGLAGRVVSRMGAATARTILAGFFEGMGDMLKSAATTQSTSALGTTTTVDSSQVAKYSIGGGLSEGANSLHDFYLSLAKQATPVIEVGATKKITVIISEGKELQIKELNDETL